MKLLLLVILPFFLFDSTIAQSKSELVEKNGQLNLENESLKNEIETLKREISDLKIELAKVKEEKSKDTKSKPIELSTNQCQATSLNGSRCVLTAVKGSIYCQVHIKKTESNTDTFTKKTTSNKTSTLAPTYKSSSNKKTIYTGPRGGKYYINSKGKKVYVKK